MRTPFTPLLTPALALVVLTALAACMPAAPPAATPTLSSPSPTATATATEEPIGPTPATVVITASLILVNDSAGTTIDQFDYFNDPTAVITAFTEYFGGDPVITPFEGGDEGPPSNDYSWDEFTINISDGGSGMYGNHLSVQTTAATVRGLAIETVDGIAVGDTAATASAVGAIVGDSAYLNASLEIDHISADNELPGALVFVHLALTASGGTIIALYAPSTNFGQ